MRIREVLIATLTFCLLIAAGCEEENRQALLEAQEKRYFDLYITANYSDVDSMDSGLYFIEYLEGEGISSDTGEWVLMNYVAYTIPDENVVDTYTEEWAIEHNIYTAGVMYGPYKYLHGSGIEGVDEGLSMMKEGGIARLLFKSDLGYGDAGMGNTISAFESLMYDIELVEVIGNAAEREQDQIDEYLATVENYEEIYDAETEATMYYIPEVIGDGDTIGVEDAVEIFYTGILLDGREFDSNIGESSFDVTIGEESVIRGWEIGLTYFNYGGSGKLLIPHELAYKEEGKILSGSVKYGIPPFEALLFDIEVEPEEEEEE